MNVKQIHDEISAAMRQIAEKHGMVYTPSTLRYSDADCRVTIQLVKAAGKESQSNGYDAVKMGFATPGTSAYVILNGKREKVLITKNTGRGRYHFQTSTGHPMAGPYALFTQD
jgi:nitrogenase molybdenum-iron protein alpha/beta subunit